MLVRFTENAEDLVTWFYLGGVYDDDNDVVVVALTARVCSQKKHTCEIDRLNIDP